MKQKSQYVKSYGLSFNSKYCFFACMKLVFTAHIIFDNAFIEEEPNEYVKRLENIIEK